MRPLSCGSRSALGARGRAARAPSATLFTLRQPRRRDIHDDDCPFLAQSEGGGQCVAYKFYASYFPLLLPDNLSKFKWCVAAGAADMQICGKVLKVLVCLPLVQEAAKR